MEGTLSPPPFFGRRAVRIEPPFRALSANERQLLRLIQREAPLSRAELARRTGLALPTVSRLVDQLLRDGLVVAEEKVMMGRMGQPSLPLSLAPHAAYAIGVAVRADALTVTLSHLSGQIVASDDMPHDGMTRVESVGAIAAAIGRLVDGSIIPPERVCGLGLALPGFFIEEPYRINAPLGMEDWATADLERDLGAILGLPVLVENDGTAATLGESLYGHGQHHPSFAYLYIDQGLGGGVVIDGVLMRGRRGNAGEFTGMLPPQSRAHRPTLSLLRELAGHEGALSAFLQTIGPDHPAVDDWLERVTPATNAMLSAIGALLDPDAVILGGRLPASIGERLAAAASFYSVPVRGNDRCFPRILSTAVTQDAAALGAGALCFRASLI